MTVLLNKAAGGILLWAILCTSPVILLAQDGKGITLQQLIDSARQHLPVLAQKKALISSATAQTTFTQHSFLPSAVLADEVSVSTDNSLPGSYLSFGLIPSTSSGIHPTNNYQPATGNIGLLYSQYTVADFGYKHAAVQNARALEGLSKSDLEKEQYQLAWQTGQLYFLLAKSLYQLEVDRQNVQRYTDVYRVIQAVTQSGIRPGADSSLALAELSKARIQYNQTAGKVYQVQQQLSYLSGINAEDIRPDTGETKTYLGAMRVAAKAFDSSIASPLTDYYEKQQQVFTSTESLVKKSYLPKVMLTGIVWGRGSSIDYNSNYKSLTDGLGYQRLNYMAGVTIAYDLLNPLHKRDKLAVSHYQTVAGAEAYNQQKAWLLNVNNSAEVATNTAWQNLQELPVQIKAALDGYSQKTAQYKAGIINLVDFTNASFVLYRAQTDYVQTLSDWFMANLDKAAATGNLNLFIQSVK
jgi:outer membrane protein TolC